MTMSLIRAGLQPATPRISVTAACATLIFTADRCCRYRHTQ
jgi:hypothetical protein